MARHFVDSAEVLARAGNGGSGCCSFRREKFVPKGGPDGGDGGHGGSVCLVGDEDVDSLMSLAFSDRLIAENGGSGEGRLRRGKNGSDLVVPVPLGTSVSEAGTGRELGDILEHGQMLVLAKGGRGGLGNVHFKSSQHRVPREFTPGEEGDERRVALNLRIMADAGLVGFPSAGKSSILRGITRAKPKVAAYHFTTLNPIIGTVEYKGANASLRVADIPGLIEDAHLGVGLGIEFLRHVERSKALVFVIDMAAVDGRKPWEDYAALLHELEMRDPALLERERIVVANKMDLDGSSKLLAAFKKKTKTEPLLLSAETGLGMEELKARLFEIVRPEPRKARVETKESAASVRRKIATIGGISHPSRRNRKFEPGRARTEFGKGAKMLGDNAAPHRKRLNREAKAGEEKPRKGYTPPKPKGGRGEHPGADDVIGSLPSFLKP